MSSLTYDNDDGDYGDDHDDDGDDCSNHFGPLAPLLLAPVYNKVKNLKSQMKRKAWM